MRTLRRFFTAALSRRFVARVSGLRTTSAIAAASLFVLATGVFLTSEIVAAPAAQASSTATIYVGATSVRVGQTNNLGISLSGFSSAEQAVSYQVTLKYVDANDVEQTNGTLTATANGTTAIAGYSGTSGTKIGFSGTYAQVSAALATVAWTPTSSSSGLTLRIGLAEKGASNIYYDANSGHYYEYVTSTTSWASAKTASAAKTYKGLNGYLAHLTTRSENDFIARETTASNIWIGFTDSVTEGQWRWSGATITGETNVVPTFASWAGGEPNNSGDEDCAVTNWGGSKGYWNDLPCGYAGVPGYLVEYGGAGGTLNVLTITKDATMGASNALATWTSPDSPSAAATQEFRITFNYDVTSLSADDIINVGSATGCTFTPASSSVTGGSSTAVTASGCSDGTVQPKLLENSVNVSGGLVIPASTATAITVTAGDLNADATTTVLNTDETETNGDSVTLTVTPRDAASRRLGSGQTVTANATLAATSVVDNGNGTYTVTVTPGSTSGTSYITVSVNGTVVSDSLTVFIGAQPNISGSSFATSGTYEEAITAVDFSDAFGVPSATYSISSGALPEGVSIDSDTGVVSGVPTDTGVFTYRVTATNRFGSSQSLSSTLTINRAPTFSGGDQSIDAEGSTSAAYSAEVRVSSLTYPSPTYSVASGTLPPGVTLSSNGNLSGTPSTIGEYTFTIRATNVFGSSTTAERNVTIGSVPIVLNDDISQIGYLDEFYSERPTFAGYPSPTFSVVSGDLPGGLSINESTGRVSGYPAEAGTFSFKVRASNFAGHADTATITLTISADPVYGDADDMPTYAVINEIFSGEVNFIGPVQYYGIASCDCEVSDGDSDGLPVGLSINHSTGVISGYPTIAGNYHFRVTAIGANLDLSAISEIITIQVRRLPTWVDSTVAPVAPVNQYYSDEVVANSIPSSEYSLAGNVPTGLSINGATGAITGTPTVPGNYLFTARATNVVGTISTASIAMVVSQPPTLTDGTVASATLKGVPFADGVSITAFPAPTYTLASGSLPPGITLNSNTGVLTGTPTNSGTFSFAITGSATSFYSMTSPTFTINVEQAPVVTDSTITPVASVGRAYSDAVGVEAFPAATFTVSSGSLPAGLSLNASTGDITGVATTPGDSTFVITASNSRGSKNIPLTLAAHEAPGKPIVTLAPSALLGAAVTGSVAVTGFPEPTFYISGGALPNGVSLNKTSGRISGTPSEAGNFTFTIGALNSQGSSQATPSTITVLSPGAKIDIAVAVGEPALGAPVQVQSKGLAFGVDYTITVRSTPQIVGSGTTTRAGEILAQVKIPENLEPGWHSITLVTQAADGSALEEVAWFEITATGLLEEFRDSEPSAAEKTAALDDDLEFYELMGINAAANVPEEVVSETVQEVSSVVASVALVSAAAAATAAVASAASAASVAAAAGASASAAGSAASAGGTASNSAAGARTATPGGASSAGGGSSSGGSGGSSGGARGGSTGGGSTGGSSGSSGGSSGSSNSSGSSGGADGDSDSADYGNIEAEHDDFTVDHVAWGDALAWWSSPFMTVLDRISVAATEYTSRISPVLSRIINDGAYLRAMFGGGMALPYIAAFVLGAVSVDGSADGLASAGNVATLSVVLVLGTLDAFAGLLGIISFTLVSVSLFGIDGLGDIRYLLAMFIAGFAPIILSTTFRKIRRPKAETLNDVWERIVDVFMIAFVASLTTLSVVGGISAFAGATVPLADNAKNLVFVITGVALARILLEEFAARSFPARLDRINPTEVSGPGVVQPWLSLIFKYAVLVLMIGDMVGWGWWLWTGALVLFVPSIMGMTLTELPKSKLLTQLIPGGLAALLLATLLSTWSGEVVSALFAESDMYGPLSFLLVPLPVIIVAIVGMFADGGEKWYVARNLKWVYIVGGIGVFASTVWATDFVGQIFG